MKTPIIKNQIRIDNLTLQVEVGLLAVQISHGLIEQSRLSITVVLALRSTSEVSVISVLPQPIK